MSSTYPNEEQKTLALAEKLIRSAERLADIHSRGEVLPIRCDFVPQASVPDRLPSFSADPYRKRRLPDTDEFSNDCRPAEEYYNVFKPTQAGDVFSLGCNFYAAITGGEHPFGEVDNRTLFVANNLYDLSECQDDQLRKLIARMICYDSTKRPTSRDLLDHPYLWKEDRVESYLMKLVANIDENSEKYRKWKSIVQFSSDQQSFDTDMPQESIVKTVFEILMDIKDKKQTAWNACQMFPNLLSFLYFTENPSAVADEIDISSPETFGNVLIANTCFDEVQPAIGIKRRHGRFGLQPVHVMQFPSIATDSISLLKRLSCLNHPNLLRYFYLGEKSAKNLVLACEPFYKTLDTLMKENSHWPNFETAKEILTQITTALVYYHHHNIIHGNLTSSQIIIMTDYETITAKIAKFPTDDEESIGSQSLTKQNDVRKLGQIYKKLLQRVENDMKLSSDHLVRSMTDPKDEHIPPSDAVFYHPFFWSPEEMADFLLVSSDFYADNPTIDKNSRLFYVATPLVPPPEHQQLTTNRSAIEYFSSSITNGSTAEDQATLAAQLNANYPMLVTQTWLSLQTFKTIDEDFDLGSFYHPNYDFPTKQELVIYEKKTSEVTAENFHSPKDEPEGTAGMEIALLDEGYCEEFIVEEFREPQSEKKNPMPQLFQSYLEKYLLKWKMAEKNQAMVKKMKHPAVDLSGRTALHLACYSDDLYEPAAKLIDLGFDPNTYDQRGFGPLHVAALNNSIKIGKLLIKNRALIDKCDLHELRTPLFLAAIGNSIAMLDLLIKKCANINPEDAFGLHPLHIAAASGASESLQVAELLLKNGANVDVLDEEGNTPLHIAVTTNRIDMAWLLLKYNANPNIVVPGNRFGGVLHMAVANCSPDMLRLLLTKSADPNVTNFLGENPLHLAAALQFPINLPNLPISINLPISQIRQDIIEILMTFKANPHAVDHAGLSVLHTATLNQAEDVVKRLLTMPHIEIDLKEKQRKLTALHFAAWYGSENIVRMLIAKKANIDARDYKGETPLEYAASSNAVEIAKLLLEADAKARCRRWKDRSPLHIAAAHGARQVAELLIAQNADVNAVDEHGLTPLHYAEYRKQVEFVQFFQPLTKAEPCLSQQLSPADVALIPELTNSFKRNSINVPTFQIKLPAFIDHNFELTISQQIRMYSSKPRPG